MRLDSPSVFSRLFLILLLLTGFIGILQPSPAKAAISPTVAPAITLGGTGANVPYPLAACGINNIYYAFYFDETNGIVYMSYSTNGGASWTVPLSIYTPANWAQATTTFAGSCQTNAATPQFFFEWINNAAGANKYRINYTTCTLISTGTSPCASATVPTNTNGFPININSANSIGVGCINWPGFECAIDSHNSKMFVYQGANLVLNVTGAGAANGEISFNGNFYALVLTQVTGSTGTYYTSTSGALNTWSVAKSWTSANGGNMQIGTSSASTQGFGSWLMSSPATLNIVVAYVERTMGGNCAGGGSYCIETVSIGGGGAATTTVGDTPASGQCIPQITSDSANWAITCVVGPSAASAYAISTNLGLTWSQYTFTSGGFSYPQAGTFSATGGSTQIPFAMGAFPVVEVSQVANYNVYVQMFGTFTGSSGGGTTNVTLGSCPTKNTATFALTNSTEFFYTATALGGTIVSQISAEVASVNSGHASSETLYFMLYSTGFSGAISATNPLFLINVHTWTLSATSTPQLLTTILTSGPGVMTGATYGIAILGNTKILVNQSSLGGMSTTPSGGASPGTPQSSAITALTSTTTMLYFCANANYQNVVTTTTTVTSTSTVSNTGTITTTVTSTTGSGGGPVFAITNSNGIILLLLLLLPTAVFMGITRNLVGALVGLSIGAIIAVVDGVLSPFFFTGLLIALVAVATIARTRDE